MTRLAGKVAVVTGAGSGIGAATARAFCAEGASVVAADISGNEKQLAHELGERCIAVNADVSKSDDVKRMLEAAVTEFGSLDILFNNAGIDGPIGKLGEYSEEDFDKVWAVNARGVFLGMRYAIPMMLERGGGSIVNTASMASYVAFPGMPAYCASKGAVLQLTKSASAEYGGQGIRVNAVCPGAVRTPITSDSLPEDMMAAVTAATPMGRLGEPSEIANLVVFLASDESSFVTGAGVLVDGGYTVV